MAVCVPFDPLGPYLSGLVGYVDCQARAIGSLGYQSWVSSGTIGLILTSLVTILVALFGYRLLLGRTITLHALVGLTIKVGLVVVLATQWSAYRTLAYDVVMDGPQEIASQISGASELEGSLVARAQSSYEIMDRLANPESTSATPSRALSPEAQNSVGWAAYLFLTIVLGAILSVRIAGAILLALGPLFVCFLMFESTRGIFLGWIRILSGVALGSVACAITLAVELSIVEPQLRALLVVAASGQQVTMLPGELLATVSVFGFVFFAGLAAMVVAAVGLSVPHAVRQLVERGRQAAREMVTPHVSSKAMSDTDRSRAEFLSDAIRAADHREERGHFITSRRIEPGGSGAMDRQRSEGFAGAPNSNALGQSWRRTTSRHSRSGRRREVSI